MKFVYRDEETSEIIVRDVPPEMEAALREMYEFPDEDEAQGGHARL